MHAQVYAPPAGKTGVMSEFVRRELSSQVAVVTLCRPELHNAFNETVIEQLTAAFLELASATDVRAVVLAAIGKSFCAGADIQWMKRMVDYSFDKNVADAATMARMLRSIRECPKPVIARVHGAAIGGGVGLVAACDMAVAVRSAVFSLSEVKLGIVPAVISPYVLEKIGAGAARRYALTAERFGADEARRLGLVSEVVDTIEELDACIEGFTDHIRANGPQALAVCKQVLSTVAGHDWKHLTEETVRVIADRRVSPEGQDGLKAYLEKRKPGWTSQDKAD